MTVVFWALASCTCNTIIIELISKRSTGVANSFSLFTFLTFLFMSIEGILRHPEFFRHRYIPIRSYIPIILIFFIVNLGNNRVLGYNIPFPLIIIFRSGTLIANVILTWLLQNKRYSIGRIISTLIVTMGIVLFTLSSSKNEDGNKLELISKSKQISYFILGVLVMSITMFASAYLGILQEKIFMLYGKHPDEMMFFVHFISLPLFLFVAQEIINDFISYLNAPKFNFGPLQISTHFSYLIGILIFQLICLRSVYRLAAELNSLQVTMILTLRKFLNIFFSVIIFKNEFGFLQFISTIFVLAGTFTFYNGHWYCWNWLKKKQIVQKKMQEKYL